MKGKHHTMRSKLLLSAGSTGNQNAAGNKSRTGCTNTSEHNAAIKAGLRRWQAEHGLSGTRDGQTHSVAQRQRYVDARSCVFEVIARSERPQKKHGQNLVKNFKVSFTKQLNKQLAQLGI